MECQTLPSTSSLSGTSGDGASSMAPRRRTTLPKAAVFILPKRQHTTPSSSDFPPTLPNLPTSPMPSSEPYSVPILPEIEYDAMDVDFEAAKLPTPLPPQLRGRVKHLPRTCTDDEPISSSHHLDLIVTPGSSSVTSSLPSRRPRYAPEGDSLAICARSGLRQVLPPGASVSIGATTNNPTANGLVALSVQTATQATATACAYDDFVTSHKPSLWKRFTRRVKGSIMNGAPRPALNLSSP